MSNQTSIRHICNIADMATEITRTIQQKNKELDFANAFKEPFKATKLQVEMSYLMDKLQRLLWLIGQAVEQSPEVSAELQSFDWRIPNDFWEQTDNKLHLRLFSNDFFKVTHSQLQ